MEQVAQRFGPAASVWVARNPAGFGFIEFQSEQNAQMCIDNLNDAQLGSQRVKVQFAKTGGRKAPPKPEPIRGGPTGIPKHRIILKNLPASFNWRELKDEMRRIGDVIYADVDELGEPLPGSNPSPDP